MRRSLCDSSENTCAKSCTRCKERHSKRAYRAANSEKDKDYQKRYYSDNCEAIKLKLHDWRADNKDHVVKYKRKARYGLSAQAYEDMLVKQGGLCALCNKPESYKFRGKIRSLAVDHCHRTGKIRGLLCTRCNLDLGVVEKNLGNMAKIKAYLGEL